MGSWKAPVCVGEESRIAVLAEYDALRSVRKLRTVDLCIEVDWFSPSGGRSEEVGTHQST